ncbi:MAG: hypothetical protein H6571_09095 [Lewinellaceae bacterium]|nr:hypothetical protein [Lewinellaceae bacterium]
MENQDLIEIVKEMAFSGKDYESIKKELQRYSAKSSNESINFAKSKIDDYIVKFQLASQEKSKALNQIIIGLVLFLLGIGITGYTYFRGNSQYFLAYGAILIGAWIFKEGYKTYRKPIEELVPGKNVFRRE